MPKDLKGKTPAVICLHGHSGIYPYIREGNEAERKKCEAHELDYACYMAEHGYITLAAVQRGWNETRNETPHSCHRVTMDAFLIGMTPVGLRTWDAMRLLDFLETREEVDGERIGAAGLSGGGTTTLFFAARDERVKVALVAGYFCTFRDSIYEIHHCICNCVPHIMEWGEMSDVAALIAPRPMLAISGDKDRIFPIEATKRAYAQLAKTYEVLGASETSTAISLKASTNGATGSRCLSLRSTWGSRRRGLRVRVARRGCVGVAGGHGLGHFRFHSHDRAYAVGRGEFDVVDGHQVQWIGHGDQEATRLQPQRHGHVLRGEPRGNQPEGVWFEVRPGQGHEGDLQLGGKHPRDVFLPRESLLDQNGTQAPVRLSACKSSAAWSCPMVMSPA